MQKGIYRNMPWNKNWSEEEKREYHRQWAKDHPEKIKGYSKKYKASAGGKRASRNNRLKRQYGITLSDYDQMLKDQNNICPICNEELNYGQIDVDHCHTSKKVRGILHTRCNTLLGYCDEDTSIIKNAIKYLENHSNPPNGFITVYSIDESTGQRVELFSQSNLVMYNWAYIIAKSFGQSNPAFGLAGMIIEFFNCVNPGDVVSVPSYTRADGLSYYTGLSSPGDYLRVPLSGQPSITISAGYGSYFTAPAGNVINAFAQTSGTAGQLGRPFSSANNSTVFGVALVAMPVFSDPTSDQIFARTYFSVSPNHQQLKAANSQIGISWSIPLL